MDLDELYKSAIEDPTLLSTIDIDALIKKTEEEDNHYLENKSLEQISNIRFLLSHSHQCHPFYEPHPNRSP